MVGIILIFHFRSTNVEDSNPTATPETSEVSLAETSDQHQQSAKDVSPALRKVMRLRSRSLERSQHKRHTLPPLFPTTPTSLPPISSPLLTYLSPAPTPQLSPQQRVLALCEQTEPRSLATVFSERMVEGIQKVGEGTFSEVFRYSR
ncbi:hypothetical protein GBAR_LOCUS27737 [Geodia barretti]|uniref:Uncharacterized protein n=1 Tax=Geodia barretti TaxID=519541 RepID=A0AA35TMC3_GEOBA|nr:hypothetical protein GBAR_LOCUS27737 [Geodia barretti]